eukprot:10411-Rhodomonas_salina.1
MAGKAVKHAGSASELHMACSVWSCALFPTQGGPEHHQLNDANRLIEQVREPESTADGHARALEKLQAREGWVLVRGAGPESDKQDEEWRWWFAVLDPWLQVSSQIRVSASVAD